VDFLGFMVGIVTFTQKHTVIVVVFTLGLLFFMRRKPKLFFSILFLGLFLAGLFYMIMNMATSGSEQKRKLTHVKEKQFDTDR
jgi:hypothetical protein